MSQEFQVLNFIIADEIRSEVGGKHIVVGAYVDTIVVESLPSDLRLAIRLSVKMTVKASRVNFSCMVLKPDSSLLAIEGITAPVIYPQYGMALAFNKMGAMINQSGSYQIFLTV